MSKQIAIIDLGGQYCHMISRRLRDLGVWSEILPATINKSKLVHYDGIILSGGPRSVYEKGAPTVDPQIFRLGKPVLGICYGHQLMAQALGAQVEPGDGEFGSSKLDLRQSDTLFKGTPKAQTVWMSHSDSVSSLPPNATLLAATDRCKVAAFGDFDRKLFGVQFHPEVDHTEHGRDMLRNFAIGICGIQREHNTADLVANLISNIRDKVQHRSVFFFVSGGVDSTVAFALCAHALPKNKLLGVYVDTGLMRKNETQEFSELIERLGLKDQLSVRKESSRFLSALRGVVDPEKKRHIIGQLFVKVQQEALRKFGIDGQNWLLGQGTIYPDTIESGGKNGTAAVIKTHHNRCEEIRRMLEKGMVIEPLAEFYKDEVRQIGAQLGLDPRLTNRWPFPGPGLAIRCLCTTAGKPETPTQIPLPRFAKGFEGVRLPLRSVGVQGDGRTYREVVALQGPLDYRRIRRLSTHLCNVGSAHNRVIYYLAGKSKSILQARLLARRSLSRSRLASLREADYIARSIMESRKLVNSVWQFPVVLIPVSFGAGESIVLRPVNSSDGMTANFAQLKQDTLQLIAQEILRLKEVDAVFLDVSDKPPATIEWE